MATGKIIIGQYTPAPPTKHGQAIIGHYVDDSIVIHGKVIIGQYKKKVKYNLNIIIS